MNAADIKEMMNNWNNAEAAVREAFPSASDEQVYQLTSAAMKQSLGL